MPYEGEDTAGGVESQGHGLCGPSRCGSDELSRSSTPTHIQQRLLKPTRPPGNEIDAPWGVRYVIGAAAAADETCSKATHPVLDSVLLPVLSGRLLLTFWEEKPADISDRNDAIYVGLSQRLRYQPFCADFGPNNLGSTHHVCQVLKRLLLSSEADEDIDGGNTSTTHRGCGVELQHGQTFKFFRGRQSCDCKTTTDCANCNVHRAAVRRAGSRNVCALQPQH